MAVKSTAKSSSITAAQSTTLLKNLFRAAFSSVAYIRNFFEDDCFQLGKIGATRYHKIVSVEKDDVKRFVEWLEKGVFDALQQKYLDLVLLEVYEEPGPKKGKKKKDKKRKLVECYTFSVSYKNGSAQLELVNNADAEPGENTRENIKRATSELLRSLVQLTSSLRPLPEHRTLSMKLLYTKNTPSGYEPPLFRKALDREACWFEETPFHLDAGSIATPFHQLSMTIRANEEIANKEGQVGDTNENHDRGAIDTEKASKAVKVEKERSNNEDWNVEATEIIDVGSCNASSGRAGKRILSESQDFQSEGNKKHRSHLQKRKKVGAAKKPNGDDKEEQSKASGLGKAGKKRKTSIVGKDIEQKRQRVKKL